MPNPETLKDILAYAAEHLAAQCPNIKKVHIAAGDWFDLLYPSPTFPMVMLWPGGWQGDSTNDEITEYRVNVSVFVEQLSDHHKVVLGSDKFPGILDLTAEGLAGLSKLGSFGIFDFVSARPVPSGSAPEAGYFDADKERMAIRQRAGFIIRVNE